MALHNTNIRLTEPKATILYYIQCYANQHKNGNIFNNDFQRFMVDAAKKNNHHHILRLVESLETNTNLLSHQSNINGSVLGGTSVANNLKKRGFVRAQNSKANGDVGVVNKKVIERRPCDLYDIEEVSEPSRRKGNKLMDQEGKDVIVVNDRLNYKVRQPRQRTVSSIRNTKNLIQVKRELPSPDKQLVREVQKRKYKIGR